MDAHRIILRLMAIAAILTLVLGVSQAQDSRGQQPGPQPQADLSLEARVSSKFSYQGVLWEGGSPVNGSRSMVFRLYSNSSCSTQAGSDINAGSVLISDGLFDVELPVVQDLFDGQALWLRILIGGTPLGCEEILPVPYALSLRSGATISAKGSLAGWPNVQGDGWSLGDYEYSLPSTQKYYGLRGDVSGGTSSTAVEGTAENTKGLAYGVHAVSHTSGGTAYGLFAEAEDTTEGGRAYGLYAAGTNADTVLGGKEGLLRSDPGLNHSYLNLVSDAGLEIHLDADKGSDNAHLTVYNEAGKSVFEVDEESSISQSLSGDGLVKAAVVLPCDGGGGITRYFNNVTGTATNGPTYKVGRCQLALGFDLSKRYWTVSLIPNVSDIVPAAFAYCLQHATYSDTLQCAVKSHEGTLKSGDIHVIVY